MRRWICPTCDTGALAPDRPRRDDVRRYCLPCSQRTGRLVERTCPALDKQRATRAAATKERTAARRARDTERAVAARSHNGVDLLAEAKIIWRHMADHHRGRPMPELRLRFTSKAYCTGNANRQRAVVSVGRYASTASALMVLTHELAHSAAPNPGDWHDERWADCYVTAARARWGATHFVGIRAARGYAVDKYVAAGIRNALAATERTAP